MTAEGAIESIIAQHRLSSDRAIRIGILGHVGSENLGDEAIIAAVIDNLRQYWPSAVIIGFTGNPDDTRRRHGIESYAIRADGGAKAPDRPAVSVPAAESPAPQVSTVRRVKNLVDRIPVVAPMARAVFRGLESLPKIVEEAKFLLESRKALKGLDLLIFAGSHQLNDYVDGPWSFPYTIYKWTLLAKRAGAQVVFLSMGAGPIDTPLGRWFIGHALRAASYRSYRDTTGKRVIDGIQPFASDSVVPDLAFSLDWQGRTRPDSTPDRTIVGLNPLPLYAAAYWFTSDKDKYSNYIGKLAAFCDWLVDRGCEVRFIPTQLKVDPGVIDDVLECMKRSDSAENAHFVGQPKIHDLDDLLQAILDLDIMVATRYHGILLSLALQKPVLAVAYHKKSQDLMNWLELGDYVIDADSFELNALTERFPQLEQNRASISESLGRQIPEFRAAVRAQYDDIFRIVEEPS